MAYTVTAWLAVRSRRHSSRPGPATLPPVTVLKPLCGAEPELYDCLRSFCDQAYPSVQIVCGVRDADDDAVTVVLRLQREFPGLDLQIAINPAQHGSSGKVSNLINMMAFARHDNLVVADRDRKSTRLNSSHQIISYAVFCLKKKNHTPHPTPN